MMILLPPSEGKALGGEEQSWRGGSMALPLDPQRSEVIGALANAMRGSAAAREKLLGVKGKALDVATTADRSLTSSPTLPAIERYTGVLYEALDYASLPATHRKRLDTNVVIFSGLWGGVAPRDMIPHYKLKMGASLPKVGKLASFWRDPLTEVLMARAGKGPIWNLLPAEHAAAFNPPVDTAQYSVKFLEQGKNGSLKAVTHWNKFLKGALVRYLASHPKATPADFVTWEHPSGYRYDPSRDEVKGGMTILTFVGPAA